MEMAHRRGRGRGKVGGGACNRKSNLAELKWKKREKLGQEEVKVGSDWQFLGSALATCHMARGNGPSALWQL